VLFQVLPAIVGFKYLVIKYLELEYDIKRYEDLWIKARKG